MTHDLSPAQRKVLELLRDGPKTRAEIADGICLSASRTKVHTRALEKLGLAFPTSRGGSNPLWFLPEDEAQARKMLEARRRAGIDRKNELARRAYRTAFESIPDPDAEDDRPMVHRIIPAHNAPRLKARGPASVWQLAEFVGRG